MSLKTTKTHKIRAAVLISALIIAITATVYSIWNGLVILKAEREEAKARDFSESEFNEVSPFDAEKARLIDAMPQFDSSDSWAVFYYMCGSDLESSGLDELSDFTSFSLSEVAWNIESVRSSTYLERISSFKDNLELMGLELPMSLSSPAENYGAYDYDWDEYSPDPDSAGAATSDIKEILSSELSENVDVIIQTGGSRRWEAFDINPNKSERFLISFDGFSLLSSTSPRNMGSQDALADFLRFAADYKADHKIFIFWNHGAGSFGVCSDEIFADDILTLSEIRSAFESVFTSAPPSAPFELIGFDACLMASLEVAESISGFARYMVASEELEPGDGWDHETWLSYLSSHRESNGAQIGKVIADSYIRSELWQVRLNENLMAGDDSICFSVIDLDKINKLSDAYGNLCRTSLMKCIEDESSIRYMAEAALRSIKFAASDYDIYNTIDLGSFVDNLMLVYPDEAREVKDALDDAVLYSRGASYEADASGLSVYFPVGLASDSSRSLISLLKFLEYIDEVPADPFVKALYYYKIAGCLSTELESFLSSRGYDDIPVMDPSVLKQIEYADISLADDKAIVKVPSDAEKHVQRASLSAALYDHQSDSVTYLGEIMPLRMTEETIEMEYMTDWIMLDGNPLSLEIMDEKDGRIIYRSPVMYNGNKCYLIVSYDEDSHNASITGVRDYDSSALLLERNLKTVKYGDRIRPIYLSDSISSRSRNEIYGKSIRISDKTEIGMMKLEDGDYLEYAVLDDFRSDYYNTSIISYRIKNNKIKNKIIDKSLKAY